LQTFFLKALAILPKSPFAPMPLLIQAVASSLSANNEQAAPWTACAAASEKLRTMIYNSKRTVMF
jgi:hypothetical protein